MKHEIRRLAMNMSWQSSQCIGSLVDRRDTVTATLITTDGEQFPLVVGSRFDSNYAYDTGHSKPGQTVEDAWFVAGCPEIKRVEVAEKGHDFTHGRIDDEWDSIIWYVPQGRIEIEKLEMIAWAAKALAAKEIGFSEFKRIIRENS
jgi:hypothetical protein